MHGIVRQLAEELFLNGEQILSAPGKKAFVISPLQMHAITRRIKLAEPPCGKDDDGKRTDLDKEVSRLFLDSNDPVKDLSHVLDFLCHVKYVQVCCQYSGNR